MVCSWHGGVRRQFRGHGRDWLIVHLGQLHGFQFGVYELVAIIAARIKPGLNRFRRSRRSLLECNNSLTPRFQAVVRNRQERAI
jgi:hypothetical protein